MSFVVGPSGTRSAAEIFDAWRAEEGPALQVAAVKPVTKVRLTPPAPSAQNVALAEPSAAERGWKKGPDPVGKSVDTLPVSAFATRDQPSPASLGWVKGPDAAAKPGKTGRAKPVAETTIAARSPAKTDDEDATPSRRG